MLTEPLPTTLDVRKAAARDASSSGAVDLSRLQRLRDLVASGEGHIDAVIRFSRDEERRSIATVSVEATLMVHCQRCLESMPVSIRSENQLAVVGDDEAAKQLPAALDPWVLEGEQGDLWALVEDELILALPVVAYHDTPECLQLMDEYRRQPETEQSDDNPFKVLEQLKRGTSQQEK